MARARSVDKNAKIKRGILKLLKTEPVTLEDAAKRVGTSRQNIWLLAGRDKKFGKALDAVKETQDKIRRSALNDSMLKRILDGTAAPGVEIFYLCNKFPDEFRHVQHIKTSDEQSRMESMRAKWEALQIKKKKKPAKRSPAKTRGAHHD